MIGQVLSHYRIESLLGTGGMGVVYLARDERLNRPVALKVLKTELTANPDRLRRFFQEARSAAAVTHPAIAQIYDVGETGGTTYIVMEFVEGKTVRQLIAQQELDLLGSVEIALQVAEGLGHAHRANIVHRDVKSDNIMVTPNGHAKLLDFGLAKLIEEGPAAPEERNPADLTRTATMFPTGTPTQTMVGTVMGTVAYMSPEQARGKAVDQSSDVFSLGIVLYEMVTGELPFRGVSPIDTMHSIVFDEAKPVTEVRKNLPLGLHQIVSRCLRKNPSVRYADAGALADDLKRLKKEIETGTQSPLSGVRAVRQVTDWIRSGRAFTPRGIVFLLAGGALIVLLLTRNFNWGSLIPVGFIGLMVYRSIRDRKRRMMKRFTAKASRMPGVKAIMVREDRIAVVVEKAQAKIYITLNALLDDINRKLYFGKPFSLIVRDDLAEDEFQRLLRDAGVVFVAENVVLKTPGPSTT